MLSWKKTIIKLLQRELFFPFLMVWSTEAIKETMWEWNSKDKSKVKRKDGRKKAKKKQNLEELVKQPNSPLRVSMLHCLF